MKSDSDFTVSRRRESGTVVVAVTGDIDLATVDAVRDELHAARDESQRLVFDLRGVTFMDSSGLRLLVALQRESEQEGRRLVVIRGPASLQRLLELSGLGDRITVVDDLAEAIPGDEPSGP